MPTKQTTSISQAALLVELSIGVWEGRKRDKTATNEVTTSKHASRGSATVNKKLLTDSKPLEQIVKFAASVRAQHRHMTLPWAKNGSLNLLTNEMYFQYHPYITQAETTFYQLVTDFLDVYPVEIQRAMVRLGDLFDAADYPTVAQLRSKFKFQYGYMPMPETGDFRLDINHAAKAELNNQWQKFHQEKLEYAMNDVWHRLKESLTTMSLRLESKPDGGSRVFRDTLVGNVQQVVDIMKACNVTKDPNMEKVRIELSQALSGVTPDKLRANTTLREKTRDDIDRVIANLPTLDM